jgi:hypothetical protein
MSLNIPFPPKQHNAILQNIFQQPSDDAKTLTIRSTAYNVTISEDTLSFKEDYSPVLATYVYSGSLTFEEIK